MDLFASRAQCEAWQAELATAAPARRHELQVQLCWQQRQSDSRACAALAAVLLKELPPEAVAARLRVALAEAEARTLLGDIEPPFEAVAALQAQAEALGDEEAALDALYLRAWLETLRGQIRLQDDWLEEIVARARRLGDSARLDVAEVTLAFSQALRDPMQARLGCGHRFEQGELDVQPAARAWVLEVRGTLVAELDSQYGQASVYRMQASEAALEMGQWRLAINSALNVVDGLANLNDAEAGLPWAERALALARQSGWPLALGRALLVSGETLRRLERLDSADERMREGMAQLRGLERSRLYAIGLQYLGALRLDQGELGQAREVFTELVTAAERLDQADLRVHAHRGLALACAGLGERHAALAEAQLAWQAAQLSGHALRQVDALCVLAELHLQHPDLPAPPDLQAASPALHYLALAWERAERIGGYRMPARLLRDRAEAHAALGEHQQAYQLWCRATQAQRALQQEEAAQRAMAAEVSQQSELERAEAQRQRQLAAEQQRRTEIEQRHGERLQALVQMAHALTAELELPALLNLLQRQLQHWFEPTAVQLLVPEDGAWRGLLAGSGLRAEDAALGRLAAEALAQDAPLHCAAAAVLAGPLRLGERRLGVLLLRMARAPDGQLMSLFQAFCAYLAIALDNARGYQALRDAQHRLVAQEKHAQLGSLVAGVASELEAPAHEGLQLAQALEQRLQPVLAAWTHGRLGQAALRQFLDASIEEAARLQEQLQGSAALVQRFRDLAEGA